MNIKYNAFINAKSNLVKWIDGPPVVKPKGSHLGDTKAYEKVLEEIKQMNPDTRLAINITREMSKWANGRIHMPNTTWGLFTRLVDPQVNYGRNSRYNDSSYLLSLLAGQESVVSLLLDAELKRDMKCLEHAADLHGQTIKASMHVNSLLQECDKITASQSKLLQEVKESLKHQVKLCKEFVGFLRHRIKPGNPTNSNELTRLMNKCNDLRIRTDNLMNEYSKARDEAIRTTDDYDKACDKYRKLRDEANIATGNIKSSEQLCEVPGNNVPYETLRNQVSDMLENEITLEKEHDELASKLNLRQEEIRLIQEDVDNLASRIRSFGDEASIIMEEKLVQAEQGDAYTLHKKLAKELGCNICLDIPREPVITTCEHLFCKSCINKARRNNGSCPVCRRDPTPVSLPPIPMCNAITRLREESLA